MSLTIKLDPDNPVVVRAVAEALLKIAHAAGDTPTTTTTEADDESAPPPPPADEQHDGDDTPPPPADEQHDGDDTPPPPADDVKRDHNGVPFNPEFCANAAKPFYESGPRLGQWKKGRGVDDAAYDAWYSASRSDETPPADTGAAFAPPPPDEGPKSCGELMAWVSEQQVAKTLDQAAITNAYEAEGVTLVDLLPPNSDADVKDRVQRIYNRLSSAIQ